MEASQTESAAQPPVPEKNENYEKASRTKKNLEAIEKNYENKKEFLRRDIELLKSKIEKLKSRDVEHDQFLERQMQMVTKSATDAMKTHKSSYDSPAFDELINPKLKEPVRPAAAGRHNDKNKSVVSSRAIKTGTKNFSLKSKQQATHRRSKINNHPNATSAAETENSQKTHLAENPQRIQLAANPKPLTNPSTSKKTASSVKKPSPAKEESKAPIKEPPRVPANDSGLGLKLEQRRSKESASIADKRFDSRVEPRLQQSPPVNTQKPLPQQRSD